MFPRSMFPTRQFPPRLFPDGIGKLVNRYAQILIAIQDILQASGLFGTTRAPIIIRDEPFPIGGGPCAYIIPEESYTIEGQHMGDGRFFYGFTGNVTIRVTDSSMYDYVYNDILRLTKETTGLYRIAHQVINMLDIEFLEKDGENLTQEPMVLVSHEPVRLFRKAKNIGAFDLKFRFPYSVNFQRDDTFDDPTTSEPFPTNLADLLLSVKDKMLRQGFLNDFQALISLTEEPFPLVGGPFAVINAQRFSAIEYDKYGAGRNYASMEGTFSVSPVVMNTLDITQFADNAVSGDNSNLSIYSCVQYLIEQLCLSFLHDPDGNFLAETPLDLISIGAPRYYNRASNYVTLPLIFKTKYQEALT